MIEVLLYSEIDFLCIAVLTIIALDIKKSEFHKGLRPTVLLKYIAYMVIFYLCDILGKITTFQKVTLPNAILQIGSAVYFLIFSIASYLWFAYSEILHNRKFMADKKRKTITSIPVMVLALLLLVSLFNECMFYVDNGVYARGKLFFLSAVISYGYMFIAMIRCLYYSFKVIDKSKKANLRSFACYSLVTLICGIARYWITEIPFLIMGNTLSVLVMYLRYCGRLISNDPLTEIPNRRKLMHYLSERTKNLKSDEDLWFVFVDLNHFKQINDKYVHSEGDRILTEVTTEMREFCLNNDAFCARYGGDEFALVKVQKINQEFSLVSDLSKFIDDKDILVNGKTRISASVGYTKRH